MRCAVSCSIDLRYDNSVLMVQGGFSSHSRGQPYAELVMTLRVRCRASSSKEEMGRDLYSDDWLDN